MAKLKRGRAMFASGSVGRPSMKRSNYAKTKIGSSEHPYGADWPSISAAVKKRDDYKCMAHKVGLPTCQNRFPPPLSGLCHAHHIVPWNKCKSNKMSNLVTLCVQCHEATHGGKHIGHKATDKQIRFSKKLR